MKPLVEVIDRRYKGFFGIDVNTIVVFLKQYSEIVSIIKSESSLQNFVIQITHVANEQCLYSSGCFFNAFPLSRPTAVDTFFSGYNFAINKNICSKVILVSNEDIFIARDDIREQLFFIMDEL